MSIERVFVLGAGLMGHGIAQVSAAAGKRVTLSDRTAELAKAGRQRIAANLARQVEKGKVDRTAAEELLDRVATAHGTDDATGHDIVIEAADDFDQAHHRNW